MPNQTETITPRPTDPAERFKRGYEAASKNLERAPRDFTMRSCYVLGYLIASVREVVTDGSNSYTDGEMTAILEWWDENYAVAEDSTDG